MDTILLTGAAGFIGASLALKLLETENEYNIIGIDNLNEYYSVELKQSRLNKLMDYPDFHFIKGSIADKNFIQRLFYDYKFDLVINLAAQAGVRYSITNPDAYVDSNLIGFFNILEACRHSYDDAASYHGVKQFIYASSSSVYGSNEKVPYSTTDKVDNPISLYAATKKADELMAHAYAKLYGIPSTGLRFFTVYGPMGRPDMAYFKFTDKIIKGEPIQIYNNGDMYRDFTYIDDIVIGIEAIIKKAPLPNVEGVPYRLYNIGNHRPESLLFFVETLEKILLEEGITDKSAKKEFLPMQPGDVYQTYADVKDLIRDFDFQPKTTLEEGLRKFARWYKAYYH